MNKKGQFDMEEINPFGILFGIVGAGLAFWISGKMNPGFFWRLITVVVTGVVCYLIPTISANN